MAEDMGPRGGGNDEEGAEMPAWYRNLCVEPKTIEHLRQSRCSIRELLVLDRTEDFW